jgi:DhnA family fructose-bisphosphate aldolase class Ia
MIEFIFMLTHDDVTVSDAPDVLTSLEGSGLRYVGFKDIGPGPQVLAEVTASAHAAGMEVMLEVVSTSADDELRSLRAALDIGVDWVLGGTHPEQGEEILAGADVRYCPFPGIVRGHPSVLEGEPEEIAAHAERLTARPGIHGVDLLAYRHRQTDPVALTRLVVAAAHGPVIAAGSVTTVEQIHDLARAGAWGFTIGSAIFDRQLPGGPTVAGQVRAVLAASQSDGA